MQLANCAERRGRRPRRCGHGGGDAERFAAEALPQLWRLYPAALRLAGTQRDAEELVAETYARAYASLSERGDAGITTWLYRNMASAAEEGAWPDYRLGQDGDAGTGTGTGPGTGDGAGARNPRGTPQRLDGVPGGTVKEALHEVPARSRFAIYLADVEGYSAPAIARILQLPSGSVTSRLRRGRRKLRAALEARA